MQTTACVALRDMPTTTLVDGTARRSLPLSAATAHEVQDKHDQCDNEHDVNQPARHMHDEAEQPKNNENHSNC